LLKEDAELVDITQESFKADYLLINYAKKDKKELKTFEDAVLFCIAREYKTSWIKFNSDARNMSWKEFNSEINKVIKKYPQYKKIIKRQGKFKMALFTTNYNEVQENDYNALPTGEYEVLILSIKERETPNGKIGMNFDLVVRNDLKEVQSLKETNGKFANRRVFTTEWKRNKNGSYKYELNNFMHYLAAVKVPEGTEIKDLNHLASLLRNKPVRVYIKEEENTYKGNTEMVNTIAP